MLHARACRRLRFFFGPNGQARPEMRILERAMVKKILDGGFSVEQVAQDWGCDPDSVKGNFFALLTRMRLTFPNHLMINTEEQIVHALSIHY